MIKETKEILNDGSILYEDDTDEGNYYRISKRMPHRYYNMLPELFEQIKKFHECMNTVGDMVTEMGEISNAICQITGPEESKIADEYDTVYNMFFDVYVAMESKLNCLSKLIIKKDKQEY